MVKWRVNILCLIGALIGFFAIFSAWYSIIIFNLNLVDLITLGGHYLGTPVVGLLVIGGIIFIIGTLLAFITPFGGIVQIAGLGVDGATLVGAGADLPLPNGIGFYLGIISAVMVIVSLFKPIGLRYDNAKLTFKDRILVLSKIKEQLIQPMYPMPPGGYVPPAGYIPPPPPPPP